MANARAKIALTDDEVRDFLAAGYTFILVTVGPDGLPDPVPMWYVVADDGAIEMTTYGRSQKVVNLRREPRAVGLVEDGRAYGELRGVQLTGRVEIVEDDEVVLDAMVAMSRKYAGVTPEQEGAAREASAHQAQRRVLMRLHPERTTSWDHRKQ